MAEKTSNELTLELAETDARLQAEDITDTEKILLQEQKIGLNDQLHQMEVKALNDKQQQQNNNQDEMTTVERISLGLKQRGLVK